LLLYFLIDFVLYFLIWITLHHIVMKGSDKRGLSFLNDVIEKGKTLIRLRKKNGNDNIEGRPTKTSLASNMPVYWLWK